MLQAVLFEFDGVLADTHGARRDALFAALADEGVVLDEVAYREHCAWLPVRSAVMAAFRIANASRDDTSVELTAMKAEQWFGARVEMGVSLTDGARELVAALHPHARLGIVSRAARRDIDRALALADMEHAFEFVISDDDPFPPKPSPAPYRGALQRLARRRPVVPSNVVALEDGPAGIRAAKGAQVRCAAVGPLPLHLAVDADALLPSLVGQTAATIDAVTQGTRTADR